MAGGATYFGMLALQRIFCLRVVKSKAGQKLLPSRGGVAVFATLLEGALVRVDMAIRAAAEAHASESRRPAPHVWLMTLFACHLDVHAS